MVSVNPISSSSKAQTETLDAMDATLPELNNSLQPQPAEEDGSKKIRKPYVISKSRESWTEMEHDKFLEALHLFDRDWKKIEAFVGSKTVIQIRSHAQKYFLKVQKNGMSEHVPPPRPKRKAAHPYPQKASKIAHVDSQALGPVQPIVPVVQPVYALPSSSPMPSSNAGYSTWTHGSAPQVGISHISNDRSGVLGATAASNFGCSSSTESSSRSWCANLSNEQGNPNVPIRAIPGFAQVYNFIGSVFAPNTSGHLQKLKNMDPINVETTLLLMRNLAANLTSPEFESHRQLLASYNVLPGKGNTFDNMHSTTKVPSLHHNLHGTEETSIYTPELRV